MDIMLGTLLCETLPYLIQRLADTNAKKFNENMREYYTKVIEGLQSNCGIYLGASESAHFD